VLGVSTIGVTDQPLAAQAVAPRPERGDRSELRLAGQLVGFSARTRTSVRPVCVTAGWRTDPETATRAVLVVCEGEGERTPPPLRGARQRAREARSRGG